VRDDSNHRAARAMAVLRPLRVVIENYPEGQVEEMEGCQQFPRIPRWALGGFPSPAWSTIEQDDFREVPPPNITVEVLGGVRLRPHPHHLYRWWLRDPGGGRGLVEVLAPLRSGHSGETPPMGQSSDLYMGVCSPRGRCRGAPL